VIDWVIPYTLIEEKYKYLKFSWRYRGLKWVKFLAEKRGMPGVFCDRLSTINCLDEDG